MSGYKILKFKGSEVPKQYNDRSANNKGMIAHQLMYSLRDRHEFFRQIDPEAFYEHYPTFIYSLLDRPDCVVKIAVLDDDPDVVLGWAIIERDIVHYCFVMKDQRRNKVATALLSEPFSTVSHCTKLASIILNRKYPEVKMNPFC